MNCKQVPFIILLLIAFFSFYRCDLLYSQSNYTREYIGQNDGLSDRWAYDILRDQQGILWVATNNGLNRYDGKNFFRE